MEILVLVGVAVVAFVAGALVGRKNKKGVEALLAKAKADLADLQAKFPK
jgi:hypothetical protein